MVMHVTRSGVAPVPLSRSSSIALLLVAVAAGGCARLVAPANPASPQVGVEALQPFGSEPELMPALAFEPRAGRLDISAPRPVYVTVVEVDPATQAHTVVFPELGRAPLRVAGALSLQLELSRTDDVVAERAPSGRDESGANRRRCATVSAGTVDGSVHCPASVETEAPGAPARTVLVIASTDTLVVAGAGGVSAWRIPNEMPAEWAAVYVWAGTRPSAP
jgi:hypothetical protein